MTGEPDFRVPPQIRSDGSVAPEYGEDPAFFGPHECAECSGHPWTICGCCGRQGRPDAEHEPLTP